MLTPISSFEAFEGKRSEKENLLFLNNVNKDTIINMSRNISIATFEKSVTAIMGWLVQVPHMREKTYLVAVSILQTF